eukprot:13429557-Heterocapsa_arctica.AAC.1
MVQRLALVVGKVIRELLASTHLLVQDLSKLVIRELRAHLGNDEPPAMKEVRETMIATPRKPRQ